MAISGRFARAAVSTAAVVLVLVAVLAVALAGEGSASGPASGTGPAATSAADRGVRCASGRTVHRGRGTRLFAVASRRRVGDAVNRFETTYLCSPTLRRPVRIITSEPFAIARRTVRRVGPRVVFGLVEIGGEGSASTSCWAHVRDGSWRCATFDDTAYGPPLATAVGHDGAMAILFDYDGVVLYLRNASRRLGRPRPVGTLRAPHEVSALALTAAGVAWTRRDRSTGTLPLTGAPCDAPTCRGPLNPSPIGLTGAGPVRRS